MLRSIYGTINGTAVQAFVKQYVAVFWYIFPRSKGAGFLVVGLGLFEAMQIIAALAISIRTVLLE